jgi:hypothetical protein
LKSLTYLIGSTLLLTKTTKEKKRPAKEKIKETNESFLLCVAVQQKETREFFFFFFSFIFLREVEGDLGVLGLWALSVFSPCNYFNSEFSLHLLQ